MNGFYEKLLACKTREEVRAAFFAAEGLVFPAKQKFDCTERALYVFRREKRFSGAKGADGIAASLAQALYFLRELKYGESACGVPRRRVRRGSKALRALLRAAFGRGVRLGSYAARAVARTRF